jgi:PAS domain-containing protein
MESAQKPLELILARNLITSISTPAFLLDHDGRLVFYNEAAGALLGRSFEDTGRMSAEEWISTFGPFDEDGKPMELDTLATTRAVAGGRPMHAEFRVRSATGEEHRIEASAVPIVASEHGSSGAMVFFWPLDGDGR